MIPFPKPKNALHARTHAHRKFQKNGFAGAHCKLLLHIATRYLLSHIASHALVKSIETHARAFMTLNILSIGTVSYVNSFMYLFGGKSLTEDASWAKLHYYITYLFCSTICIAYLPTLFWKYSSLYLEISNIVLDTISLPHKTYTHPSRQLHSCLDRKKNYQMKIYYYSLRQHK